MHIAVTGSSGFIGTALMAALGNDGVAISRNQLSSLDQLAAAIRGADAVVHLAGLAHRTGRSAPSPAEFDAVNRDLPVRVYEAAATAGVARFIHVSTINVVAGNSGTLKSGDPIHPTSPYGISKAEGEEDLREAAARGSPELIIVRPPLVYGPGARGNMGTLTRISALRLPLPFAAVRNHRGLVGVNNLVSAILFLAGYEHPLPPPAIFHVTDGSDLSLRDLVTEIRSGLGRSPGLFWFPPTLLKMLLTATGRQRQAAQLLGDLRVDDSPLRSLGWTAPHPPSHDLAAMGRAYASRSASALRGSP